MFNKIPNSPGLDLFFEKAMQQIGLEPYTTEKGLFLPEDRLTLGCDFHLENTQTDMTRWDFKSLENFLEANNYEGEFHYRALESIQVDEKKFPPNSQWGDIYVGLYQKNGEASFHAAIAEPSLSDYKSFVNDRSSIQFESERVGENELLEALKKTKTALVRGRVGEYEWERGRIVGAMEREEYQRVSGILGIMPGEAKQFCWLRAQSAVGYVLAKRFPDGTKVEEFQELMGQVMSQQKLGRGLQQLQHRDRDRARVLKDLGMESPPLIIKGGKYVLRNQDMYAKPNIIY